MRDLHTTLVLTALIALSFLFAIVGPGWISLAFGVLLVFSFAVSGLSSMLPGTRAQAKASARGFELNVARLSTASRLADSGGEAEGSLHRRDFART